MDYEMFKERMIKEIRDYFPERYRRINVKVIESIKVNANGESIVFEYGKINPSYPLSFLYYDYRKHGDFINLMKKIAQTITEALDNLIPSEVYKMEELIPKDLSQFSSSVFFQVINAKKNHSMLEKVPHRKFLDFAVIYRIKYDGKKKECVYSSIITNKMLYAFIKRSGYDITEDDLFGYSMSNYKELFKPNYTNIKEFFAQIKPAETQSLYDVPQDNRSLYCITTSQKWNGAASIFYTEIFSKIADIFNEDLYIFPSSIEELIVAPQSIASLKEVKTMVEEINVMTVEPEIWLSDNVYGYCRAEDRVFMFQLDESN